MARKKAIEDEKLLELIDEYHTLKCANGTQKIKLPLLAEYIASKGVPEYRVETLRRNEKARLRIDTLNQMVQEASCELVSTYKTMDVENFLENNKSHASLKAALIALDAYYRDISKSAGNINKKYNDLKRECESLEARIKQRDDEIIELVQKVRLHKERADRAEAEKKRLKGIVTDYVYPDIANALLAECGDLVNAETIIDPGSLAKTIISGDTRIEEKAEKPAGSAVVRNLFECFDGD